MQARLPPTRHLRALGGPPRGDPKVLSFRTAASGAPAWPLHSLGAPSTRNEQHCGLENESVVHEDERNDV
jgi:hypothetical protein